MRGKAEANTYHPHYHGITPAYAGKSTIPEDLSSVFWDHPRLCGEKAGRAAAAKEGKGSPPPMRGKDAHDIYDRYKKRITPAYAGKRSSRCSAMHRRRDHPRLCGEKPPLSFSYSSVIGSPPPMRGKVNFRWVRIFLSKDHPRLCGEKLYTELSRIVSMGSPPPMRGKVLLRQKSIILYGITPAYAGKSPPVRCPTICGSGSPPPMRGKD